MIDILDINWWKFIKDKLTNDKKFIIKEKSLFE